MIGIYNDSFGKYIKDNLGNYKVTSSNIICRCPWCESEKKGSHNHLYISLDKPIFNCFKAGCNTSGTINKFVNKITGTHIYNSSFVDNKELEKLHSYKKSDKSSNKFEMNDKFIIPVVDFTKFKNKENYLRKRLQFAQFDIRDVHGLIFDVEKFIDDNKLISKLSKVDVSMLPFLQKNFVGFITEHHNTVVFRNIDQNAGFRYYKMSLQHNDMLDYYKISHNIKSNLIVIGEGIFDIFNDHMFNYVGYRETAHGYYCSLNNRFESLIKSVSFYDNLYDPDVVILSDNNVSINYYKKIKKRLKNICSSITVYYNSNGDDFGDTFCSPERILL